MPTNIRIVNDTIIPGAHDSYETGLTPRETQTRIAFFVLAFGAPVVAAIFTLFTTRNWWTRANLWTYPRLCTLWFLTVAAFAAIVFFEPGRATRTTFVIAIIHGMIEISMITLLLGWSMEHSLIASMVFALVDFTLTFAVADLGYIFMVASILGGANDFLIPLLLWYGKLPLLSIGAFSHTVAAVSVFTYIVHDYGVLGFTMASFLSLWPYVGFTVAGLRASFTDQDQSKIHLPGTPDIGRSTEGLLESIGVHHASKDFDDEYPKNPMKRKVSLFVLGAMLGVSLVGSTGVTLLLAYVAPTRP